jgi:outer membrane protein
MKPLILWTVIAVVGTAPLRAQQATVPAELPLQQAIAFALEHSPDLKSTVEETSKRSGYVTTARSTLLPQLDAASDFNHSRMPVGYPAAAPPSLSRFAGTTYSVSANLHMLAWDFQQSSLQLAATRERLASAQILVDRQKQDVIFNVANLYLQAMTYQDLLHANELTRKSLTSLLDRTNELVKAGRAVPVDAYKIQTQVAAIDSDSATLEAGRQAMLSSLAAAMGHHGELPTLTYTPATEVPASANGEEQQLLQTATQQRPDLKAASLETKSAYDLERAARRAYWPRVDFNATAIQYGAFQPVGFSTLVGELLPSLDVPSASTPSTVNNWTVGFHLSVPVFDSGRRRGQIRSATAQAEQARLAERKLDLDVAREVRTSYAELVSAQTRVKAMQEAVVEAQEVLKNEQIKYEVGRTVINFVLEAEAAVLNSQSLLAQAQRSEAIASLSLELATGRISADLPELQR